jgi:hypothetical protein
MHFAHALIVINCGLAMLTAFLLTTLTPVAPVLGNAERITVRERFSGVVCAGVCIDSDLTVRRDGLVEFRVKSGGGVWTMHRLTVSAEQVSQFWAIYASIRPLMGVNGPVGTCDVETAVIDFEMHWNEWKGSATLLACRDRGVQRAYREGFRALRISPVTGEQLTAEQAARI